MLERRHFLLVGLRWCLLLSAAVCVMDARPAATSLLKLQPPPPGSNKNSDLSVDEEFWTRWNSDTEDHSESERLGDTLGTGIFSLQDGASFATKVHRGRVVSLERGCGRGPNRLATLSDGSKACCRYRPIQWKEIRGEFFAYHLNNLLGMHNAPPATLVKINFASPQWREVKDAAIEAEWTDHSTIIMTQFMEELTEETIPPVLRENGALLTNKELESASPEEKSRILQWSDLVVFDFIMGHSDRIFNTLFNLQWNARMLQNPVHNLLKTKKDEKLLLFDNESGFWMGYKMGWKDPVKYELQERFLKKMCVFRNSTLEKVKYLLCGDKADGDKETATKRLERYIKSIDETSFMMVESLSKEQNSEFESRLKLVLEQVKTCRAS